METYDFIRNDYGGNLIPTILDQDGLVVDLSFATINFLFEKPDGTEILKVGDVYSGGQDGKALYTFDTGDLDQAGIWYYRVQVVTSDYSITSSEKKTFHVRYD